MDTCDIDIKDKNSNSQLSDLYKHYVIKNVFYFDHGQLSLSQSMIFSCIACILNYLIFVLS